jgi:hypothetical protein
MKSFQLLPFVLCAVSHLFSQTAPAAFYAESFRQGSAHIVEAHFDVKLTPQNPTFRERIKDSHGADRYVLSIIPQGPEGDTEITSWQVKLADLHHTIYDNVLLTSQLSSSDPKDALWRLEPGNFARVPLAAARIIKVDSFYVLLQVKEHHFIRGDAPYLDSMTVLIQLTNTDPRSAEDTQK